MMPCLAGITILNFGIGDSAAQSISAWHLGRGMIQISENLKYLNRRHPPPPPLTHQNPILICAYESRIIVDIGVVNSDQIFSHWHQGNEKGIEIPSWYSHPFPFPLPIHSHIKT